MKLTQKTHTTFPKILLTFIFVTSFLVFHKQLTKTYHLVEEAQAQSSCQLQSWTPGRRPDGKIYSSQDACKTCGSIPNGQPACKSITECVICVNGGYQSAPLSACAEKPCGPEEAACTTKNGATVLNGEIDWYGPGETVCAKCVAGVMKTAGVSSSDCVKASPTPEPDPYCSYRVDDDCARNGLPCVPDSSGGHCGEREEDRGECNQGQFECVGVTQSKYCKTNGAWSEPLSCSSGTICQESTGRCEKTNTGCTPGAYDCQNEDYSRHCNANGEWETPTFCSAGCVENTGKCSGWLPPSPTPKPTDAPVTYDSQCTNWDSAIRQQLPYTGVKCVNNTSYTCDNGKITKSDLCDIHGQVCNAATGTCEYEDAQGACSGKEYEFTCLTKGNKEYKVWCGMNSKPESEVNYGLCEYGCSNGECNPEPPPEPIPMSQRCESGGSNYYCNAGSSCKWRLFSGRDVKSANYTCTKSDGRPDSSSVCCIKPSSDPAPEPTAFPDSASDLKCRNYTSTENFTVVRSQTLCVGDEMVDCDANGKVIPLGTYDCNNFGMICSEGECKAPTLDPTPPPTSLCTGENLYCSSDSKCSWKTWPFVRETKITNKVCYTDGEPDLSRACCIDSDPSEPEPTDGPAPDPNRLCVKNGEVLRSTSYCTGWSDAINNYDSMISCDANGQIDANSYSGSCLGNGCQNGRCNLVAPQPTEVPDDDVPLCGTGDDCFQTNVTGGYQCKNSNNLSFTCCPSGLKGEPYTNSLGQNIIRCVYPSVALDSRCSGHEDTTFCDGTNVIACDSQGQIIKQATINCGAVGCNETTKTCNTPDPGDEKPACTTLGDNYSCKFLGCWGSSVKSNVGSCSGLNVCCFEPTDDSGDTPSEPDIQCRNYDQNDNIHYSPLTNKTYCSGDQLITCDGNAKATTESCDGRGCNSNNTACNPPEEQKPACADLGDGYSCKFLGCWGDQKVDAGTCGALNSCCYTEPSSGAPPRDDRSVCEKKNDDNNGNEYSCIKGSALDCVDLGGNATPYSCGYINESTNWEWAGTDRKCCAIPL
jgi:hypothetical protein